MTALNEFVMSLKLMIFTNVSNFTCVTLMPLGTDLTEECLIDRVQLNIYITP